MEPTIFKFIWRHSRGEQIKLVLMTLAAFPFLYLSLDLPKIIINEAIGGTGFPREVLGHDLEQIPYLMVLSVTFLGLVLINGAFKYVINVYRGMVGERMLRRLRYALVHHVLRFPLPQFRRMSQGEIVAMVTGETEPLGGYIGDSVALPAFQGGTLLTILVFMFIQDWVLGLAAIALYPVQAYVIPKLQRRVNLLKKERTIHVRRLSERIGEVVGGIQEVRAHDTSQFELAEFSKRMGDIYQIRLKVYLLKFLIKFINNFIAQITPFFFYAIGGYLVITGSLSFGALVAVLAAYKDLSAPWKELLNFYQIQEDARIKYDLLYETFEPGGLLDETRLEADPPEVASLSGELVLANVDMREPDEGENTFDGSLTLKVELPARIAVVGDAQSGAERLAGVVAGVRQPLAGSVLLAGIDLVGSPHSFAGRRVGYVNRDANIRAGTVRDNLFYSLKHRPARADSEPTDPVVVKARRESLLSGNSPFDIDAEWIDYPGLGLEGAEALTDRALVVLDRVDMAKDIYELGLQGNASIETHPALVERLLAARAEMRERLQDPDIAPLVELFDADEYNTNMSVAENLLFGTPRDPAFNIDVLAENPYVRKVLHETGLMRDFLEMGRHVAEVMVDLFTGVEPGSELFEQFSFIGAEDLPEFRSLLSRTQGRELDALDQTDRVMLLSLPFKLIPARHRLGLIDEDLQARIVDARRRFADGFGLGSPPVDFFDRERYNPAVSIQDNILFGRLAFGKARSAVRVGEVLQEVVENLELRRSIMEVGLDFSVGLGGSRLSAAQRQKLAIARSIVKHPEILVVDQATASLDEGAQRRILEAVLDEFRERSVIWVVHRPSLAEPFDAVVVMSGGRVAEQGTYEELDREGSMLRQMLSAG